RLFTLLLLPVFSADILNDHLVNNVDSTVNPCDNFFLHVCSQSVNSTEYPLTKVTKSYQDLAGRFRNISRSRNFPIIDDITNFHQTSDNDKPVFNGTLFQGLLRERCDDNRACYRSEFEFFYKFYTRKTNTSNDRLTYFKSVIN
ncbi:hypothetical protein PMAYCL1PPCAC_30948, partial [Pristionchus mayeri]